MPKVPVAAGSAGKSYYKYYEMGIDALTPEQLSFVARCRRDREQALEARDRHLLLTDPNHAPEQTGFYPLKDGGLLVAGNIPLPGVTPDMLWWWWAWHGLDPLRYAIWDCEDHFDVQLNEEGRRRALDPGVPMQEKTWGAVHTVQESIGGPPDEIVIMFQNPSEMGYDWSKTGTPQCRFLIAANALMGTMKVPVIMTETASDSGDGLLFHARFWVGYHVVDGEAKYLLPPDVKLPEEIAMGLVGHNIKEFSNLAKILPSVYAEGKDHW